MNIYLFGNVDDFLLLKNLATVGIDKSYIKFTPTGICFIQFVLIRYQKWWNWILSMATWRQRGFIFQGTLASFEHLVRIIKFLP